jgi:hypothetical protein
MPEPLTIEAEFRNRWWPCRFVEVDGVKVVVCSAGDVSKAVLLRVRWPRQGVQFGVAAAPRFQAEELARELKAAGYALVTVKERRNSRVKRKAKS